MNRVLEGNTFLFCALPIDSLASCHRDNQCLKILRINPPRSRISVTKPSSLPWHRKSASSRAKFSTIPNNLVVDHSSYQNGLRSRPGLSNLRSLVVGFLPCIPQARERTAWRIAEASLRRVAMPTPVGSASFYPIKGLLFFLTNENRVVLWKRIAKFTAEVGVAAVAICGSLFKFTFHSQQAVLLKVLPHFFGTPGTVILILAETAIPLTMFFYNRMQRVQEKLFVDVLSIQGLTVQPASADEREWIDEQREIQRREMQVQKPSIFRYLADPASLYDRPILKYFVTFPLNFIPVAGQVAFCWVNSMDVSAPLHHYYYSKLKRLSSEEEAAVIYTRRKQYEQFGVTATAFSLVPGADIVLLLTNAVGAALWAADLEKAMAKRRKL